MLQLQSALGVIALLAIAWAFSEGRRGVAWKPVGLALAATAVTAVILLKSPPVVTAFSYVNRAVGAIADATRAGTSFVFGYLGGGTLPSDLKVPGAEFVLAIQALPVLLVMSVLTTLLYALEDRNKERGLATLCLGGGDAVALSVERVN